MINNVIISYKKTRIFGCYYLSVSIAMCEVQAALITLLVALFCTTCLPSSYPCKGANCTDLIPDFLLSGDKLRMSGHIYDIITLEMLQ